MRKQSWALSVIRERLRNELEVRNLSQREFAEAVGLSRPWLTKFLNGKVALSFADADAIAHHLGVQLVDLINQKEICFQKKVELTIHAK